MPFNGLPGHLYACVQTYTYTTKHTYIQLNIFKNSFLKIIINSLWGPFKEYLKNSEITIIDYYIISHKYVFLSSEIVVSIC